VYLGLWENDEALDAYHSALDIEIGEETENYSVIIKSNIAIIYRRFRQTEEALKICQESLEIIPKTKDYKKQNHINLITITCEALIDLDDWDQLRTFAVQGLKMSQDIGYTKGMIDLHTKLGALAIYEENYSDAEEHLNKATLILEDSEKKDVFLQKNILYYQALKQFKNGKFKTAIDGFNQIIESYDTERPHNELNYIKSFELLALSYKEIGNSARSIESYEKHNQLNEEYHLNKSTVVNSIIDRRTSKLGEQIESLETRTMVSNRYKWIIFIALCITLLCFFIYLRKFKRKQSHSSSHLKKLTEKIESLEILNKETTKPKVKKDTKEIIIDEATREHILNGLSRLEKQEYYLNTDCNLRSMARKIKTNATYLSHTIHHHLKQSFNEYINDLRINYALKRMQEDRKFRSFSIKSIARELGYKSDYSFSKHFKIKTGKNPSQYIKQIQELE